MFDGLRKRYESGNCSDGFFVSLEDKDLEYLEAACLLQKIGLYVGKKGYHKQSYHIIMVCIYFLIQKIQINFSLFAC